ncbi:hypothetical protein OUZ56_009470 [Daphnia magna]|uniref:Uncharacterized protein n=1 Tax=Daphnia magna TaxID=35525 RepID=A0ABR0AG22_9CRUS|nr:hypothetical protein OUZ56_009470 [Daphnia magna]
MTNSNLTEFLVVQPVTTSLSRVVKLSHVWQRNSYWVEDFSERGLDFHTVAGQKIKDAGTVGTATAKIAGQEGWANGQQVAANGEIQGI